MKTLLLDTHAALWWIDDSAPFGDSAAVALGDPQSNVLVSAVSVWEVAIKQGLGKLRAPEDFARRLIRAGASELPISFEHAALVRTLPPHHRDPFDRLLIAQAQHEGATIVTRDPAIARYDVPTLW